MLQYCTRLITLITPLSRTPTLPHSHPHTHTQSPISETLKTMSASVTNGYLSLFHFYSKSTPQSDSSHHHLPHANPIPPYKEPFTQDYCNKHYPASLPHINQSLSYHQQQQQSSQHYIPPHCILMYNLQILSIQHLSR